MEKKISRWTLTLSLILTNKNQRVLKMSMIGTFKGSDLGVSKSEMLATEIKYPRL